MSTIKPDLVPLSTYVAYTPEEMAARSAGFLAEMRRRRTVRDYSTQPVPAEVIDNCLGVAANAPSGANRQPWHFVVVTDPEIKHRIRLAAEEEERDFYENRAPQEWLDALAPLGTDADKPFLDIAPVLIVIFAASFNFDANGHKVKNYYAQESVGIATGMLITALHHAGLATLTHTPSPMNFLNGILDRPPNERPFLVLVVGYPAADALVPNITKLPLSEVVTYR